jgi:hypothetical protein
VEPAMEIAQLIAANAPLAVQVTKKAGRKFIEAGERAAIDALPAIRERVMGTEGAARGHPLVRRAQGRRFPRALARPPTPSPAALAGSLNAPRSDDDPAN